LQVSNGAVAVGAWGWQGTLREPGFDGSLVCCPAAAANNDNIVANPIATRNQCMSHLSAGIMSSRVL
jgi:hypothetical protein